jgi:hypothetical protein
MTSRKCAHCTLVNFADADICRRCGALFFARPHAPTPALEVQSPLEVRLVAIASSLLGVLFAWWVSLVATSEPIDAEQRVLVDRAIDLLDERGFSREAFLLRRLTTYRSTDNWWNRYNGHYQAYAATNFPFEVVTLYPWFFELPADDVERAVILLHESHHLMGKGEPAALTAVWRDKPRLGWTADDYGHSKVWKNTREWTQASAPALFACSGIDGDCEP